jgi:hypothetical protein
MDVTDRAHGPLLCHLDWSLGSEQEDYRSPQISRPVPATVRVEDGKPGDSTFQCAIYRPGCRKISRLRDRIPAIHVVQESFYLAHTLMMHSRKSLLDEVLQSSEGSWPEHDTPQDEERGADRARKQEPADAGDDQQDANLLGHRPYPADFCGIVNRIDVAL